jgi:DNA (cytosine-5)-methyltransferase 1
MTDEPIPYDLLQVTAPINRQQRAPGDPMHTLARDNAAHAAVILAAPPRECVMDNEPKVMPPNGKTIGSLFAGIGGFDLGFERAGFKTAWTCEIDKKAQAVLRFRFPDAAHHDDVCAVGAHNLAPVDVVTFGSPCQDLSVAGKRAGLAGERSGLFHEAARVIRELRAAHGKPDFAIWENVPGAFSSNDGRDFAAVIDAMVNVGARDVAWRVLDSRFFGVAQRRRRVFLVADFGGERAAEVLALAEGVRGYSPKGRKARQGAATPVGEGAGSGGERYCPPPSVMP